MILAAVVLLVWLVLLLGRGFFWLGRQRDDRGLPLMPTEWPGVVAVVPARDEAETIGRAIESLLRQDYPGPFRVILVDDGSGDGTAGIARAAAAALGSDRLEVIRAGELPAGWTGKLNAVARGVAHAEAGGAPRYLLLTDADIVHAPDSLSALVRRAEAGGHALVSLMARLRCASFAERAIVPAFVWFFEMLYPFAWVNHPRRCTAAAAGGCMLVRREALARSGGIAAIRHALIDDCALAASLKRQGPIWLGLTNRVVSIREYGDFASVAAMISRSAYAQLGYSPFMLLLTLVGLGIVFLSPPGLALFGEGAARAVGLGLWLLMALMFQPILRFYGRSPLWGPALPLIAAFYAGCTLLSALQHWRGRGGLWKGRVQALPRGS